MRRRSIGSSTRTVRRCRTALAGAAPTRSIRGWPSRAQTFSRDVAAAIAGIEAALAARGGDLTKVVSGQIDALRQLLDGQGAEFVAALGARGAEISVQIAGIGTRAEKSFEQRVSALIALLTRRGDDLLAAVQCRREPIRFARSAR